MVEFDIIKGLGILMVVLQHANAPFSNFYSCFSVSLFYIIAGLLYKNTIFDNLSNFSYFLKKKFMRIALPFILINSLLLFSHNYLIN